MTDRQARMIVGDVLIGLALAMLATGIGILAGVTDPGVQILLGGVWLLIAASNVWPDAEPARGPEDPRAR